jgi:hypothetical protein
VRQGKKVLRDKAVYQDKEVIQKVVFYRDKATQDQNVTIQIQHKRNRRRNKLETVSRL